MADLGNTSLDYAYPGDDNVTYICSDGMVTMKNAVLTIQALIICLFGLVGNGIVIWFLSFKIKGNQCTVYIFNLTVADFIFLVGCSISLLVFLCFLSSVQTSHPLSQNALIIGGILYNLGFKTSSFLLTAISVEQCLYVLIPMWYQCHRQKNQSVIACLLLWAFSIMVMILENSACENIVQYPAHISEMCTSVYLYSSILYLLLICLMVSSSLTLFFKIQKTSDKCCPLRLYIVIVISVLVFILSVVPTRMLGLLLYFNVLSSEVFMTNVYLTTAIFTTIYCSAIPYVYIFVGNWMGSIKQALKNVFEEETESLLLREETYSSNIAEVKG